MLTFNRITEEQYDYFLGVVPPIDWNGGAFLVGEPCDHPAPDYLPTFQACFDLSPVGFFASSCPVTRREFKTITSQDILANIEDA